MAKKEIGKLQPHPTVPWPGKKENFEKGLFYDNDDNYKNMKNVG